MPTEIVAVLSVVAMGVRLVTCQRGGDAVPAMVKWYSREGHGEDSFSETLKKVSNYFFKVICIIWLFNTLPLSAWNEFLRRCLYVYYI